ncbi:MAG: FAD-dependent oxidoreductase, partial [SAR324 cluster bacterium]|nr:FAD-dependent oxidoreductase [SAR324 cluster bacterium]
MGVASNPLRVAIFGSGPAGFYATEELLKDDSLQVLVDLFDRLPTPYGLVRGGVAPDHPKIKSVIRLYDRTAGRDGFRFFGNVTFGEDLTLAEVLAHYHQVLFTTGSETDRRMGIPGEDLPGSFPATVFVGWYNGHPDYRHYTFDLSGESVAVVGNGNVAMDVARVLVKTPAECAESDLTEYAARAIHGSPMTDVYVVGRRGPVEAKFTNVELREMGDLEDAAVVVDAGQLPEDVGDLPEGRERRIK